MMASAVILNWKRPHNIPKIVESLLKQPFIDEILIADNSKDSNLLTALRFITARQASNELIYTQDDDCLVGDIPLLYRKFLEDPTSVVCGATPGYMAQLGQHPYSDTNLALLGWGSFWKKGWLSNLDRYWSRYPFDQDYCVLADRIFTMLMPSKPRVIPVTIEHLPGYDGPEAMCNEPHWREVRELAIQRCKDL